MVSGIDRLYCGHCGAVLRVLAELTCSRFGFRLTGSRFFGGAHAQSDYDFYASSSPDVEHFLECLGFAEDDDADEHYYQGFLLDKLYVLRATQAVFHVQLVSSEKLQLKDRLQVILDASGLCQSLDKQHRRKLWQTLVEAALGGE